MEPPQHSRASASAGRSRLLASPCSRNVRRGSRRFHRSTGIETPRCDRSNRSRQRESKPSTNEFNRDRTHDWACTHLRSCSSYQINSPIVSKRSSANRSLLTLWIFESNQRLEFSGLLVDRLAELPEVGHIAGFSPPPFELMMRYSPQLDTTHRRARRLSTWALSTVSLKSVEKESLLDTVASKRQLSIGDQVDIEFEDGYSTSLNVRGTF